MKVQQCHCPHRGRDALPDLWSGDACSFACSVIRSRPAGHSAVRVEPRSLRRRSSLRRPCMEHSKWVVWSSLMTDGVVQEDLCHGRRLRQGVARCEECGGLKNAPFVHGNNDNANNGWKRHCPPFRLPETPDVTITQRRRYLTPSSPYTSARSHRRP